MDLPNQLYETTIYDFNRIDKRTREGKAFVKKWRSIEKRQMIACGQSINRHPATVTLTFGAFQTLFQINATHYN